MKIKEAEVERCKKCGAYIRTIHEPIEGCDWCKKILHKDYLEFKVFNNDQSTKEFVFCSWSCVLKKLREIKCDDFIALPYLHYDECGNSKITAKDFLACIDWEKLGTK